jgi:hypothetical protein
MRRDISGNHPLRAFFSEALHESLHDRMGLQDTDPVVAYLAEMMVEFLAFDQIYAIRDAAGQPVESVVEMLAEGDVRQRADSFEREREVHRHIGDFLLFWSGIFPEFLYRLKARQQQDLMVDVVKQGQFSYQVVSSFDYGRYADEAPVFRKLSNEFDAYREGLNIVRSSFKGLAVFPPSKGFEA